MKINGLNSEKEQRALTRLYSCVIGLASQVLPPPPHHHHHQKTIQMFDEQLPVGLAFLPLLLGLGPLGMRSERMKKYIYLKEKSIHIKLQEEFNQVRSGQGPDSSGNR